MKKALLLLGTNLKDRLAILKGAKEQLNNFGNHIIAESNIYETAPWGEEDQPNFLNQAIILSTGLRPLPLLQNLQSIEMAFHKEKDSPWGARTLDIDILFYEDQRIETEKLTVPHPRMKERNFALIPANDIAANWNHPVLNLPISALKEACTDNLKVARFNPSS